MKRLTRQRRLRQGKKIRSPLFWGGLLLAVLLLAATLTFLKNVDKMDLPDVPDEQSGKLIFYEALKKPEGIGVEAMPLVPEGNATAAPTKPEAAAKRAEPRPKAKSPVEKAAPPSKPASAPAPKPAPKKETPVKRAEAPPSRTPGNYAVQVAASKDRKAAEDLKDRLVRNGYPGYLIKENIPGKGVWYRVRLGPFDEKADARKMMRRIKKQAKMAGILVVEKKSVTAD
jgi:DedD protein